MGKSTDFRYNTGATRVPRAAVGENYNAADVMEIEIKSYLKDIHYLDRGYENFHEKSINELFKEARIEENERIPLKFFLNQQSIEYHQ